ncbi:hypothetical protein PENFLA_c015G02129 [Penicillium flavigenum]|uniref:F-box domain-containing protein n=1 Tax=Penicillium flavigenum TaxID=254877 RepID=A0A1V6T4U7_9EURO|nr:hypothetical protein PENFLA_c015G02129 [Penicillium flavigenum]
MFIQRLPSEILELIATNLDLDDLSRLNTADRKFHAIAQRVLYALASEWNKFQYGWPVSLAVAAVLGRAEAFEEVLRNTAPFFIQKCNIQLLRHPILSRWTKSTYKPAPFRKHYRTSLLHVVSFLGHPGMVSLVLAKRVSDGSSAYPRRNDECYDCDSVTPLHLAAQEGHTEVITLLLRAGADLLERDRDPWGDMGALDFAIHNRRHDAVRLLIHAGANPFVPFSGRPCIPSLARAAELGDMEMVNLLLLARSTLKVQGQDALDSALSMSSHKGYLNMAQHLIHTGARITQSVLNVTAWFGTTAMMQLLFRNGGKFALEDENDLPNIVLHHGRASFEMKQLILESEPRLVNVNDIDGNTPLDTLYLFDIKKPEDLQQQAIFLIEAGVEVSSSSALSYAAGRGHVDVVRRLLALESQNSYINTRDLDGTTAILRACLIPENHTIAELLIRAGSDIELRKDDWPPLFFAVHAGATRTVQCLLQAGCNIHARCRNGKTALHLAAAQGNLDIIQCLLQAGLDPCAKTECGKNPLHFASKAGRPSGFQGVNGSALDQNVVARVKVVLCLIQAGADVSSQDDSENTPLDSLALLTRGVPESQRAIHHPRLFPWESMNRKAIGPTRQAQGALSSWMNADLRAWAIPLPHESENSKGDSESDDDLPALGDIFGES